MEGMMVTREERRSKKREERRGGVRKERRGEE